MDNFKKWRDMFLAVFNSSRKDAEAKQIAKHLARVWLYELKGIDALYPDVRLAAEELVKRMKTKGRPIIILETGRTALKQDEYFAKGRTASGSIITNAKGLESYHQYGLAFDVYFQRYHWNPPNSQWWYDLGKEGKSLGLVWGGSFQDFGHFEYHPGFDWKKLIDYFKNE